MRSSDLEFTPAVIEYMLSRRLKLVKQHKLEHSEKCRVDGETVLATQGGRAGYLEILITTNMAIMWLCLNLDNFLGYLQSKMIGAPEEAVTALRSASSIKITPLAIRPSFNL